MARKKEKRNRVAILGIILMVSMLSPSIYSTLNNFRRWDTGTPTFFRFSVHPPTGHVYGFQGDSDVLIYNRIGSETTKSTDFLSYFGTENVHMG
jgi:hypothetical protein